MLQHLSPPPSSHLALPLPFHLLKLCSQGTVHPRAEHKPLCKQSHGQLACHFLCPLSNDALTKVKRSVQDTHFIWNTNKATIKLKRTETFTSVNIQGGISFYKGKTTAKSNALLWLLPVGKGVKWWWDIGTEHNSLKIIASMSVLKLLLTKTMLGDWTKTTAAFTQHTLWYQQQQQQ